MNNEQPKIVDAVVEEPEVTETALAPAPKKKEKKGFFGLFRRESKRDRQLAALNDGYEQLINLISSIQMNLDVQAKNQQQLLGALENLPEVADGLKKMGNAAELQAEAIQTMSNKITSNELRDKQMSKSVNHINKTLIFMNLLFVLAIAAAISVFMTNSEKPLRPQQNQEVLPAVEEPAETTPDNEPALLVTPTNELASCATERVSNEVVACETKIDTHAVEAVEASTNMLEPLTNNVELSTNELEVVSIPENTFTLIVTTDTNQPASD